MVLASLFSTAVTGKLFLLQLYARDPRFNDGSRNIAGMQSRVLNCHKHVCSKIFIHLFQSLLVDGTTLHCDIRSAHLRENLEWRF